MEGLGEVDLVLASDGVSGEFLVGTTQLLYEARQLSPSGSFIGEEMGVILGSTNLHVGHLFCLPETSNQDEGVLVEGNSLGSMNGDGVAKLEVLKRERREDDGGVLAVDFRRD